MRCISTRSLVAFVLLGLVIAGAGWLLQNHATATFAFFGLKNPFSYRGIRSIGDSLEWMGYVLSGLTLLIYLLPGTSEHHEDPPL